MTTKQEYLIGIAKHEDKYDYTFAVGKKDLRITTNRLKNEGWDIILVLEIVVGKDLTAEYM